MSELKEVMFVEQVSGERVPSGYYKKSDADKLIADLEESHKKEVEQLLIEIVELKAQKAQAEDDCAYWKMREGNAVNAMHETEEYAMQLYNELRHHKYKRCLAMAEWCNAKWYDIATKYYKSVLYRKWELKWLKLAEKFKEVK
jgi:hypothetical protein